MPTEFNSQLPAHCLVVDENNWHQWIKTSSKDDDGNTVSESGYIQRDYQSFPIASGYAARRMPNDLILSEKECIEIIKEREATGTRLIDKCEASGMFYLDQSPSWYCWCYSTDHTTMAACISQNETPRTLNPESVAGPIMKYKKQGGWCSLATDYAAQHGWADVNVWPWESHKQSNNPKYFEPSRENAAETIIEEWWDLESWEEKRSCLAMGIPCASCYNYEGHATASVELIYRDGQLGVIDIDSYYKRNGNRFHSRARMGSRAYSDDTVAIRQVRTNSLPPTKRAA